MFASRPPACLLPLTKFKTIPEMCKEIKVEGAAIEVGVWKGGLAVYLAEAMPERKLYLADTYKGIPYIEPDEGGCHQVGSFSDTSADSVRAIFAHLPNVVILEGIFPDAFRELLDKEVFAVVHLDVDVYRSYKEALEFIYPRTVEGGLIMLDDYEITAAPGCKKACDEFMLTVPEEILKLDDQYYFIKGGEHFWRDDL